MAMLKDLLLRAATAAVGIPAAIALLFFQGGVYFALAAAVVAAIGWDEYVRGTRRAGHEPLGTIGALILLVGLGWIAGAPWIRDLGQGHILMAAGFFVIVAGTFALRSDAPIRTAGSTMAGVAYLLWTFGFLIVMRGVDLSHIGPARFDWGDLAGRRVVYIILVTWSLDTGAYLAGKWLGGPHIAPRISPRKTLGGSFGGVAGAALVSLALYRYAGLSIGNALILGALVGVVGQLGDLWESAIKREMGLKDFGEVLPGHGGVLDRFDSLFLAAPLALIYFLNLP
jgi:phosphatidate cytidylyltransferase